MTFFQLDKNINANVANGVSLKGSSYEKKMKNVSKN